MYFQTYALFALVLASVSARFLRNRFNCLPNFKMCNDVCIPAGLQCHPRQVHPQPIVHRPPFFQHHVHRPVVVANGARKKAKKDKKKAEKEKEAAKKTEAEKVLNNKNNGAEGGVIYIQ